MLRFAEDRITEPVPCDRNEYRDPACRTAVLENHGKPSAVGCVDDTALGRSAVQAVQVSVLYVSASPDTFQIIRNEAGFSPVPFTLAGMNQEEDVFSVDLIKM